MTRLLVVLAALSPLVAACNDVVCGEGTFTSGNDCIGYDPNDTTPPVTVATPPGGRSRDALPETVSLVSDEQARIYVTTDGTDPDPMTQMGETSPVTIPAITQGMTLKWLAVDRAGNREEIQTATYDSDTTPPAPPSGFTVALSGTTANLSWTPPADSDYVGTAVARVADVIDVGPVDGMMLGPGMLSSSVQVLQAGAGTAVSDPGRKPGPVRYVAWAYDDLGNHSAPVVATATLPIGSLTAQLTYDTTAMTLAMPTVPENISLAGTTAVLNGTTLTISLQVTNNTTKYFHNFKAEVTAAANATLTGQDGTADTFPFKLLSPNAFAPDASTTTDLVFTVTAGTTATIDLTLADHATVVTSYNRRSQNMHAYDLGSGILRTPALATTIRGPNDRIGGMMRKPVLTGQRFLDVPHTHGAIERFDLVTGMRTSFASLGIGDRANVLFLISTGGELIACVKLGGKSRAGVLELVRLDEGLRVRSRIVLSRQDDRGWMIPALAPDGRTLAIALVGGVMLVDLATFREIDAVPSSPISDLVPTGLLGQPRGAVWFNNGDGLLVPTRNGGAISIVERTQTGWTSTLYQDPSNSKGYTIATVPGGKIWVGLHGGLLEFDPATKQFTTIPYPNRAYAIEIIDGQTWIVRHQVCCSLAWALDQVSPTGTVLRTITLPTGTRAVGHWLAAVR